MRFARYAASATVLGLIVTPAAMAQGSYYGGYGQYHAPKQTNTHCEKIKDDKRIVGGLIGAVAGGALGVAIADDGDDKHYHRGYRGYRGYHGHRGWRHGRRHHGYYHHDDNGDEIAGALIGGVLGAVVGSELAGGSVDCAPKWNYAETPPPTRQAYGGAWNAPPQTSNYGNPPRSVVYSNQPLPGELAGAPPSQPQTIQTPYRVAPSDPIPVQPDCTTVQRETALPDGSVAREPIEVCQGIDGEWYFSDDTGY